MIEISNISLPLNTDFSKLRVLRLSVDARKKADVHFVATLGVEAPDGVSEEAFVAQLLSEGKQARIHSPYVPLAIPSLHCDIHNRPIVVGSGPAGLFCALYLAKAGLRPLVIERGAQIPQRVDIVEAFNAGGPFNPSSNIQFGEGGAGTFSDGKLTTNIKNPLTSHVLRWFVEAGAPRDIEVHTKPHIGTDVLRSVIVTMRNKIEELGGEVHFSSQLTNIHTSGSHLISVEIETLQNGQKITIPASRLVLACGHSARDTFRMLQKANVHMEQKPFSMGVRIEHAQCDINQAQYGKFATNKALPPADYKLSDHLPSGRSVYTFCMCPGGKVVCSASEEGGVVVNGMSNRARDGKNANSALLVDISPEDFSSDDPLEGVRFQRYWEQRAYDLAFATSGIPYTAPAQYVGEFLASNKTATTDLSRRDTLNTPKHAAKTPSANPSNTHNITVQPTYARGVAWCDLHDCLPEFVSTSLEEALPHFDKKIHGFASEKSVLTGIESRSSSPVRIVRDKTTLQSNIGGLYPCGEGAGYAGGIMSAAVDGLRVAQTVAKTYE